MLKKIIAAVTCSAVILSAMCGSAFAENKRWFMTYVPHLWSPNVTHEDFWNFTVSWETDENGADTEEAPWVMLRVKEAPVGIDIDTSEEYITFTDGEGIYKFVPNGVGCNWADVCYASGDVKVTVDGKEVEFPDAEPFIDINGRTMVPLRFVSEALGAKVRDERRHLSDPWNVFKCKMYWNTLGRKLYSAIDDPEGIFVKVPVFIDTGDIELTIWTPNNEKRIDYTIGNNRIEYFNHIDGKLQYQNPIALDSVGFLKENRTYIPLRFFSEVLGAKVDWDEENRTVAITSAEN